MKVHKFIEAGSVGIAGSISAIGLTKLAQHADLIPPATDVLFSSNASFGIGFLGAFLGVAIAQLAINLIKDADNDEQAHSVKKRMFR